MILFKSALILSLVMVTVCAQDQHEANFDHLGIKKFTTEQEPNEHHQQFKQQRNQRANPTDEEIEFVTDQARELFSHLPIQYFEPLVNTLEGYCTSFTDLCNTACRERAPERTAQEKTVVGCTNPDAKDIADAHATCLCTGYDLTERVNFAVTGGVVATNKSHSSEFSAEGILDFVRFVPSVGLYITIIHFLQNACHIVSYLDILAYNPFASQTCPTSLPGIPNLGSLLNGILGYGVPDAAPNLGGDSLFGSIFGGIFGGANGNPTPTNDCPCATSTPVPSSSGGGIGGFLSGIFGGGGDSKPSTIANPILNTASSTSTIVKATPTPTPTSTSTTSAGIFDDFFGGIFGGGGGSTHTLVATTVPTSTGSVGDTTKTSILATPTTLGGSSGLGGFFGRIFGNGGGGVVTSTTANPTTVDIHLTSATPALPFTSEGGGSKVIDTANGPTLTKAEDSKATVSFASSSTSMDKVTSATTTSTGGGRGEAYFGGIFGSLFGGASDNSNTIKPTATSKVTPTPSSGDRGGLGGSKSTLEINDNLYPTNPTRSSDQKDVTAQPMHTGNDKSMANQVSQVIVTSSGGNIADVVASLATSAKPLFSIISSDEKTHASSGTAQEKHESVYSTTSSGIAQNTHKKFQSTESSDHGKPQTSSTPTRSSGTSDTTEGTTGSATEDNVSAKSKAIPAGTSAATHNAGTTTLSSSKGGGDLNDFFGGIFGEGKASKTMVSSASVMIQSPPTTTQTKRGGSLGGFFGGFLGINGNEGADRQEKTLPSTQPTGILVSESSQNEPNGIIFEKTHLDVGDLPERIDLSEEIAQDNYPQDSVSRLAGNDGRVARRNRGVGSK
ncbi:hypothetical protein BGX27_003071 [Mortierella sp. AM989]|nr:hypothetical protein BGX27_003071 [Mortierella sp. AM989]